MKYKINYNGGSKSPDIKPGNFLKIKVLNFNVFNFRNNRWRTGNITEQFKSYEQQMKFIANIDADIVGLEEVAFIDTPKKYSSNYIQQQKFKDRIKGLGYESILFCEKDGGKIFTVLLVKSDKFELIHTTINIHACSADFKIKDTNKIVTIAVKHPTWNNQFKAKQTINTTLEAIKEKKRKTQFYLEILIGNMKRLNHGILKNLINILKVFGHTHIHILD